MNVLEINVDSTYIYVYRVLELASICGLYEFSQMVSVVTGIATVKAGTFPRLMEARAEWVMGKPWD